MSCFDYDTNRADYLHDLRKHDFEPLPPRLNPRQVRAVAVLISTCEMVCEAGVLPNNSEMLVRERVAEALSAFNMSASNRDERDEIGASA